MLPYNVIYQGNERIARQPERLEKGGVRDKKVTPASTKRTSAPI